MQILLSGQRRYARIVQTEKDGGRPVIDLVTWGERKRRLQKLIGKKSWFKTKKRKVQKGATKTGIKPRSEMTDKDRQKELSEKEIEAVLFMPFSPGSEMCKLVQEVDDDFVIGTKIKRIKVVERVGPTLENIMCKANPWRFKGCTRSECFPCQHGGG